MQGKKILITTVLAFIFTSYCFAEESDKWVEATDGLYIKLGSVHRTAPDRYSIWTKRYVTGNEKKSLEKLNRAFKNVSYVLVQEEHNCQTVEKRLLSVVHYDAKGIILASNFEPLKWKSVIPDSIGEVTHITTCMLGEKIK